MGMDPENISVDMTMPITQMIRIAGVARIILWQIAVSISSQV